MHITVAMLLLVAAFGGDTAMTQDQAIELAKNKLSAQINVVPAELRVSGARAVDWPDTSLGCPQPGMMYAQVITPGFHVVLRAGERDYPVHVGAGRAVVCVRGVVDEHTPKGKAARDKAELIQRARERLAESLRVGVADVQALAIKNEPACGGIGTAGGKHVVLEYAGRRYEYDAAADTVRPCAAE